MRKAYKAGQVMLTSDLSPNYCAGFYPNYHATMNAIKRRFGRCQTQDTMVDFFKKLDKAIVDKNPHEFKMGILRGILKKQYITDPDDFFICKDFDDDRNVQKYPEGYSPIINTLLQYIIFTRSVDRTRWETIEKEYHNLMNGKPTYQSWHENRQELYKLLDDEVKRRKPTVSQVENNQIYNIDEDDAIDDMSDEDLVAWVRQRRSNFRRGNGRNNFRPRPGNGQNRRFDPNFKRNTQNRPRPGQGRTGPVQRPVNNNNTNNNNYRNYTMNEKRTGLRRMLCRNCSRWAGENRYHPGPFGGTSDSNCPFDDKGRTRPGYKFIRAYYGTAVNEIGVEDFRELEEEGCEFEDDQQINHFNSNYDSFDMTHFENSIGNI